MKTLNTIISGLCLSFVATPVFAQANFTDVPELGAIVPMIEKAMGYLIPIAGLLCLVFIIIGGYMWITSAGDPAKIKQAQGTLTWAVIGLVFVLLSYTILTVIQNFVLS